MQRNSWLAAIPPIPTHFVFVACSVCPSVCLSVWLSSVVCHIRAPCSNSSTDLHAIWQVHLWGPMTHCVIGGDPWKPWLPEKGRFGVRTPSQNTQLQIADKPSVL